MRNEFTLPEQDQLFCNAQNLESERIVCSGMQWLLIHHFALPEGYNCKETTVAIMIPPGYPVAALDMAYFYPGLSRTDGKPIAALSLQNIDSKPFQRWSRHRTAANPWRPGIDDISTHMFLVDYWIQRELHK